MMRFKRLHWILPLVALFLFTLVPDQSEAGRGGKSRIERRGKARSGKMRHERFEKRKDRRGERREFAKDRRKERNERFERYERRENRYDERRERRKTRRAIGIGTAIAGSFIRSLACQEQIVEHDGITYHGCGSTWYERRYRGGEVVNIVVNPPPGY